MKKTVLTTAQLREQFLSFFEQRAHTRVPSASLVPAGDKTLLFTNAGMVPFKSVFLGEENRPYSRAVSAQRCVRAGGKHNDLENVGYTARHHTFFEMMGNFSFGDYFKEQAIEHAWEFLTKVLGLPAEKLWVTVFEEDIEAEQIWKEKIGIDPTRFSHCGEKDNFWSMGPTGPCGPCSEVFYDHGPDVAGGPPGSPDEDGDRYIEIWNLVFMQYDRSADGTLTPLPKPSVDTGMGLERVSAVMQGVHSNYEIDLFQHLLHATYAIAPQADPASPSFKVLVDHIRSCAFLIVDGILPSNEGRGYVLRRIIRRAIRHGHQLAIDRLFFYKLVQPLVQQMGEAYPELAEKEQLIMRILKGEEERFRETLDTGIKRLEQDMATLGDSTRIPGEIVFRLYDTYGFPADLTADVARERGLTIDEKGFDECMNKQRARARGEAKFFDEAQSKNSKIKAENHFVGYTEHACQTDITALFKDEKPVSCLREGEEGWVVLRHTPFYAESGGQVGDQGSIHTNMHAFHVDDTQKIGNVSVCIGRVTSAQLNTGDRVEAQLDTTKRESCARHHSATHLLHAALRSVLGEHVAQKGSLVNEERLRFDFSHFEPVTAEQIATIEHQVNEKVLENYAVETEVMSLDDAKALGAMALFDEKYSEEVRVVRIGDYSLELCGGTHVRATGKVGLIKIIFEGSVSAGVRRIEAVSGAVALDWVNQRVAVVQSLSKQYQVPIDKVLDRIIGQRQKIKELEQELSRAKRSVQSSDWAKITPQQIKGIAVVIQRIDDTNPKDMREIVDQIRNKSGAGIVLVGGVFDEKVSLVCGVEKGLVEHIKAGDIVREIAVLVGGKGGGRPDMAMAGGTDVSALENALKASPNIIQAMIA